MFNGSENLPGDFFEYLQQIGATDYNGTTWFDRTNYFQTVPKGALERALFMESDRMGYLLGAITQEKLDNQIGVVQNEKRQGDNQPGGLVDYEVLGEPLPRGPPLSPRHDRLDGRPRRRQPGRREAMVHRQICARTMPCWCWPATSTPPRRGRWSRNISERSRTGRSTTPAAADVPTLPAPKSIVMKDRVAAVQLQRHWAVPGLTRRQLAALDLGGSILGGLASSRLDKILVRDEKLAVSVTAGLQPFQRIGLFEVTATVKPGVDPALVDKRLDEIIAEFLANGPTEDEVRRAATQDVAGRIRGLEQVGGFGGKAVALAEGKVFAGDSELLQEVARPICRASPPPTSARRCSNGWAARRSTSGSSRASARPMSRPRRSESEAGRHPVEEDRAADSADRARRRRSTSPTSPTPSAVERRPGPLRAARRHSGRPSSRSSFDAGFSADAKAGRGLQNLTLSLLEEGADGMTSQQIAEEQERLGAAIIGRRQRRPLARSSCRLCRANLAPSLDLLADVVQRPTSTRPKIDRVRTQTLTAIAQAQKEPERDGGARASRRCCIGEDHPYATTVARRRRGGHAPSPATIW